MMRYTILVLLVAVLKCHIVQPFRNPRATVLPSTLPVVPSSNSALSYPGGDFIYLFGGYGSSTALRQILRFSISTETFERMGVLPDDKYQAATVSDKAGNIYIIGGWGSTDNSTILKYSILSNTVQKVPASLPDLGDGMNDIISCQEDTMSPGYLAISSSTAPYTMHLLRETNGVVEVLRSYGLEEPFSLSAMAVMGDDVNIMGFKGYQSGDWTSRVLRLKLNDPSMTSYEAMPPPFHSKVGNYVGGEGIWYLIPFGNPNGELHLFDALVAGYAKLTIDNYPTVLRNVSDYQWPTYVYVPDFQRVYVFGGLYSNGGPSWEQLSMVWKIDM